MEISLEHMSVDELLALYKRNKKAIADIIKEIDDLKKQGGCQVEECREGND